jgi:ribosomal-protein-alanine N-acetyltransferase
MFWMRDHLIRTLPINTPNLYLRRFAVSDAQKAYDNWMSDEDVTEFLSWDAHKNPKISSEVITRWVGQYRLGTMDWCITLKPYMEPIGSITAVQDFPEKRYCEIGYCIAKDHWGNGYMTEALKAVTDFIFTNTDYLWIQARCDPENHGSKRCLEKCRYRHIADADLPYEKRSGEIKTRRIYMIKRSDLLMI